MTDTTQTWLLRLQALTVAERPALLREMSRHEVEAVVLRLMAREPKRGWWARIWEWVWRQS